MKLIMIPFLYLLCTVFHSCLNHDKIIIDSHFVFNKEDFVKFSNENEEGILLLFNLLTDSINSFIPLNENESYWTKIDSFETKRISYKWMNDCHTFKLTSSDSTINSKLPKLRTSLLEVINKIDTNTLSYVYICNYGESKKPKITVRVYNQDVKGKYTYHLVSHKLKNFGKIKPKDEMETIYDSLRKFKIICEGIIYEINVSPEIGFFE